MAHQAVIFFDGTCGLCHRCVQFVLARDVNGTFLFAPLQGQHLATQIHKTVQRDLPDSIIVITNDGVVLSRSSALIFILQQLGAKYRFIATLMRIVPNTLRDYLYDVVAKVRFRFFAKPVAKCPLVPNHLKSRFIE